MGLGDTTYNGDRAMTTVYLVSDGDYSDYCVLGVFSTLALAEEYKSMRNAMNDIAEYELDPMPINKPPPGMWLYRVVMERTGELGKYGDYKNAATIEPYRLDCEEEEREDCLWGSDPKGPMEFYMFARDEKHAVKIANERRLQLLALDRW